MLLKLVISLHIVFTTTATVFSPSEEQTVERVLNDVLACSRIPSMSVGIVKNNEIWTRGFGEADRERHVNVDAATTRFGIGSLTKAFTTTLLAMLLDESQGRYTWDSKVTDILGKDFKFVDDERTKETTLKDILSHRTGLNTAFITFFTNWYQNKTRADFAKYIRFLPESHDFRDIYDYNNWMYALAGHVIEVLSGESWEATLQKKILDPLGMTSTKVLGYNLNTSSDNVAQPYSLVDNEIQKIDPRAILITPAEPAGSIASTANDMVKWIQFQLNEGKTANGRQLLKASSLKEMFKPHQGLGASGMAMSQHKPTFPVSVEMFGYGYGWGMANYEGYQVVWHSGKIASFSSILLTYPDLKFGIYIGQTGPSLNRLISFYLSDVLLGREPWLNASTICSYPAPWIPKQADFDNSHDVTNQEVTDPDRYVGTYGHRFLGQATVEQASAGGSLAMKFGLFTATLNATADESKFKMESTGIFYHLSHAGKGKMLIPVTFKNIQNGKFTELETNYPSPLTLRRGVDYYAPFPADETTQPCSSEGNMHVAGKQILMTFMFVLFVMW